MKTDKNTATGWPLSMRIKPPAPNKAQPPTNEQRLAQNKARLAEQAKAQPQHSPLPWRISNGEHYDGTAIVAGPNDDDLVADCIVYNGAREGLSHSKANAKLIVLAVNNADKLAEALRGLLQTFCWDIEKTVQNEGENALQSDIRHARQALKQYESEAQ